MYMKNTLKHELSFRYASLTLTESVRIYQKCTPNQNHSELLTLSRRRLGFLLALC